MSLYVSGTILEYNLINNFIAYMSYGNLCLKKVLQKSDFFSF